MKPIGRIILLLLTLLRYYCKLAAQSLRNTENRKIAKALAARCSASTVMKFEYSTSKMILQA